MVCVHSPRATMRTAAHTHQFSFEEAVLKGLATDNGLFIPEAIPQLPADWETRWVGLSFQDLAFEILSLFVSPTDIPAADLRVLVEKSYATFRHPEIVPLHLLAPEHNLNVLELFHGPTFAFKDVALQFVGNLFEYFLVRRNAATKPGEKRHALTVVGATSGDTGSAAIYGLRGKKDVSVFILHPKGRVSPIQEAQMTTVLDSNVHNLAVCGTFDDCQDIVKALFSHPVLSKTHNLGAVNSINWARILAQIVYYFSSYFALRRSLPIGQQPKARYVVPTGNFGDILAGYFAKRMGLPMQKLVIATNANDILDRFVRSGRYEKKPVAPSQEAGGIAEDGAKANEAGVKETLSPAMDILVSSNFERLLWYLALECIAGESPATAEPPVAAKKTAGATVKEWMNLLKATGTIVVPDTVLQAVHRDFVSERVDDAATVETIRATYAERNYVLDPHTAIGIAASMRVIAREAKDVYTISLSTAHPAKFNHAVDLALREVTKGYEFDRDVRPAEFVGLEQREKRVVIVDKPDVEMVREIIEKKLESEGKV